MTHYMTQFTYTAEAVAAMAKNPQDRSVGLKQAIEKLNGKLICIYYCFGEYDGVAIYEMPDNVTDLALLLAVTTAGHLKATTTTVLMTMEESVDAMKKAGALIYAGPGG